MRGKNATEECFAERFDQVKNAKPEKRQKKDRNADEEKRCRYQKGKCIYRNEKESALFGIAFGLRGLMVKQTRGVGFGKTVLFGKL